MSPFLRKYAAATTSGTHVGIPMVKIGVADLAINTDWTPAAGDVKVSIDGAAQANIGTLPSYTNGQWIFQFTAAEVTGKSIRVAIVDAATKAVEDNFFIIETFGNASAMYVVDYTDAQRFGLAALPGSGTLVVTPEIGATSIATIRSGLALTTDVTSAQSALSSAISNVQNNTFIGTNLPTVMERPDAGTDTIPVVVTIADETGAAKNIDAAASPTTLIVNEAGTSRAGRLSAWANPATGKYTATFTRNVADPIETLFWEITATVNGKLRRYVSSMQIVNTTAIDFTSTDRTTLTNIASILGTWNIANLGDAAARIINMTYLYDATAGGTIVVAEGQPENWYQFLDRSDSPETGILLGRVLTYLNMPVTGVASSVLTSILADFANDPGDLSSVLIGQNAVLAKLDSMMVETATPDVYQFTASALALGQMPDGSEYNVRVTANQARTS